MGSSEKKRAKRKPSSAKSKAKSKGTKPASGKAFGDETVSDLADVMPSSEHVPLPQTIDSHEEMRQPAEQGTRTWLVASIALFAIWLVVLAFIAYRVTFQV